MPSACFDAIRNVSTPRKHAKGESTEKLKKIVNEVKILWRFVAVGNG